MDWYAKAVLLCLLGHDLSDSILSRIVMTLLLLSDVSLWRLCCLFRRILVSFQYALLDQFLRFGPLL